MLFYYTKVQVNELMTPSLLIEEAKTEEKENENGEKEVVEVSPRTEKLKILKLKIF